MSGRLIICLCLVAGPAFAVEIEAVDACLAEGGGAECVQAALEECGIVPTDAPAIAALCYRDAQVTFGEALAARLTAFDDVANEVPAAIARTEAKFDMLSGFIQCDRAEELSIVATDIEGATIGREKSACMATVTGLSYERTLQRLAALSAMSETE